MYECSNCREVKAEIDYYTSPKGVRTRYCRKCNTLVAKERKDRKKAGELTRSEELVQAKQDAVDKQCNTCDSVKPLTEFFKKNSTNGYSHQCKNCEKIAAQKRYLRNVQNRDTAIIMERVCLNCNEVKPIESFGKNPCGPSGYDSKCRTCINDWIKVYYKDPNNRNKRLLGKLKRKARLEIIPFDLTLDDLVIPDLCPVLGIPLSLDPVHRDYYPSVDRIIPELGYIKGNIVVISYRANRIKNDSTVDELKRILAYVENNTIASQN